MRALAAILLVAASPPILAQDPSRCAFDVGKPLPTALSPRVLGGFYDVEWHPATGRWRRSIRHERLWLWRTGPADTSVLHPGVRPAPGDTITYSLFGVVVAHDAALAGGDSIRAATDPIFPPVLLFIGWPRDSASWSTVVLLVNTVRTRQPNVISADGSGYGIWSDHVGLNGFSGPYGPWGIGIADSGYVCARRIS